MENFQLNSKNLIWFQHTKKKIPFLPIDWKIFERVLHNNIYEFFTENNLIYPNQSGFKPGDSWVNQLLSITHEIYKSFDNGVET